MFERNVEKRHNSIFFFEKTCPKLSLKEKKNHLLLIQYRIKTEINYSRETNLLLSLLPVLSNFPKKRKKKRKTRTKKNRARGKVR